MVSICHERDSTYSPALYAVISDLSEWMTSLYQAASDDICRIGQSGYQKHSGLSWSRDEAVGDG